MTAPQSDTSSAGRLVVDHRTCTDRFRRVVGETGATLASFPITATGPAGEQLSIDVARIGAATAERILVVLSGVHGVEAFAPAEAQCDLIARIATRSLPDDVAVLLVHGVNPWGMAHGRRQNESNVDLNRNWGRSDSTPPRNSAYAQIHHLACPDTPTLPSVDELMEQVAPIVAERGATWVADAITRGQYEHADGLHFGGHRTEESCAVLERELPALIGGPGAILVVDLHTGHGPRGAMSYLSTAPLGSHDDRFLRHAFGELVSADRGDVDVKTGQIARGIAALFPGAASCTVTAEVGTTSDLEQLAATYHEHWVHRHGDPDDPDHQAARRQYRDNFTPDDPAWLAAARAGLRSTLAAALHAVVEWDLRSGPSDGDW